MPGSPAPLARPTQITHPARATWRTVVQAIPAAVLAVSVLPGVLDAVFETLTTAGVPVPGEVVAVKAAVVVVCVALTGLAARLMAIPGVNDWLSRALPGLAAAPPSATTASTSVDTPDEPAAEPADTAPAVDEVEAVESAVEVDSTSVDTPDETDEDDEAVPAEWLTEPAVEPAVSPPSLAPVFAAPLQTTPIWLPPATDGDDA